MLDWLINVFRYLRSKNQNTRISKSCDQPVNGSNYPFFTIETKRNNTSIYMRLISSSLQHTTEQLIKFFRSQTDWQVPVWRQGGMRGMNLISTISTLSIYSNIMTSHEFIPTWPLLKVSMSGMSGDQNKDGRAHVSVLAGSFVSINTLDRMRVGALIARLLSMAGQASYPTVGREADRSRSHHMYYTHRHARYPTLI